MARCMGTKAFALAAVILLLAVMLCAAACSGSDDKQASASSAPVPTPTPEPTTVPSLLQLGPGGCLEDQYVKLYIPEYLEYDSSPAYNCAYYTYVSKSGDSMAFAYLPDEKTKYDKEIGSLTRKDYALDVYHSSGAEVKEFKFTEVAGREALRTLVVYEKDGGLTARSLTYFINVNGWLLTLNYTTTLAELPEECERGILEIEIKD